MMQFLLVGLASTHNGGRLLRDDPDGVYRCRERMNKAMTPFPTFYKRGHRIVSLDWREGWSGEELYKSTYFNVEYLRPLMEGDPL